MDVLRTCPDLRQRLSLVPGNHDVNIVDQSNPGRLDLPWSTGPALRKLPFVLALDVVEGNRVHLIDRASGVLGPSLKDYLRESRRLQSLRALAQSCGVDNALRLEYTCTMVQISKRRGKQSEACCSGLAAFLSPRFFKALSDTKRVSLLIRLAEKRGGCTVGQLADGSGVDFSVVSRHLGVLREAGIIKCDKRGKEVWCTIERRGVVQFLRNVADALEACCPEGRDAEDNANPQAVRATVG